MVFFSVYSLLIWILIGLAIWKTVKGIINPQTRKKTLIRLGVFAVIVVLIIGYLFYTFRNSFSWQEREYQSSYHNNVLYGTVAEHIETYYVLPEFRDGTFWYRTGWYASIKHLADDMTSDDEQREKFIRAAENAPETNEFNNRNLRGVPADRNENVLYYQINPAEIFEDAMNSWNLGYFIVIDRNSSEAALVVYYMET